MGVTARVKCNKVEGDDNCKTVTLNPVYSNDKNDPNYSYSQATPGGEFKLTITNPGAFNQFVEGKTYDVTFNEYLPA